MHSTHIHNVTARSRLTLTAFSSIPPSGQHSCLFFLPPHSCVCPPSFSVSCLNGTSPLFQAYLSLQTNTKPAVRDKVLLILSGRRECIFKCVQVGYQSGLAARSILNRSCQHFYPHGIPTVSDAIIDTRKDNAETVPA